MDLGEGAITEKNGKSDIRSARRTYMPEISLRTPVEPVAPTICD